MTLALVVRIWMKAQRQSKGILPRAPCLFQTLALFGLVQGMGEEVVASN
jgi:hypothetical protein